MARSIKKIWKTLSSRSFALLLMVIMVFVLVASSFLPNRFTLTEEEFERLALEKPLIYKLSLRFSTPEIVSNPVFISTCFFLALSTGICTMRRFTRLKRQDFSKRRAFYSKSSGLLKQPETGMENLKRYLRQTGWDVMVEQAKKGIFLLRAHKGEKGYWGSIIFHVSLVIIFLTGVVSAMTRFNAEVILTQGIEIGLNDKDAYIAIEGRRTLPDLRMTVRTLNADFHGNVPTRLYGEVLIDGMTYKFGVNMPVNIKNLQITPSRYGIAPRFVIRRGKDVLLDSYVNLRSLFVDDYFEVKDEGLKIDVRFFPDFFSDGKRFGTKTMEEKNPVFFLKVYKNNMLVNRAFLKAGESVEFSGYRIEIPEYTHWVTMIISSDMGVPIFIAGFILAILGLLIRFLSNERAISCIIQENGEFELRGWSRYYPAFLERELNVMKREVEGS